MKNKFCGCKYNLAYSRPFIFAEIIFRETVKSTKFTALENFALYDNLCLPPLSLSLD